MNTKAHLHIATKDVTAGAVPEVETAGISIILGALLVVACFAAPLLLTLPQTMDAAASPRPSVRDVVITSVPETAFHERHPAAVKESWTDTLDETALAQ